MRNPYRYFDSSPTVIRIAAMMYIRMPLPPRRIEDCSFWNRQEFQPARASRRESAK
jgi:hypothetical protein